MGGGKKHGLMELRFDDHGNAHDVSPDLLKRAHAAAEAARNRPPAGIEPIRLASLADDDDSENMHSVHVDKEKSIRLNPEQTSDLMRKIEEKRAKEAALDAKVVPQSQREETVIMEAPANKTMMIDARYVRNHEGAAFGRGGDTAIVDLNKFDQAHKPKPKTDQESKPSLGARIKSLGTRIKSWFPSASKK